MRFSRSARLWKCLYGPTNREDNVSAGGVICAPQKAVLGEAGYGGSGIAVWLVPMCEGRWALQLVFDSVKN